MNSVCLQYTKFWRYLCETTISIRIKGKLAPHCDAPLSITFGEVIKKTIKRINKSHVSIDYYLLAKVVRTWFIQSLISQKSFHWILDKKNPIDRETNSNKPVGKNLDLKELDSPQLRRPHTWLTEVLVKNILIGRNADFDKFDWLKFRLRETW
jgi:hypothetical protein